MKYGLQDKIIYLGGNRLHASDSGNFILSFQDMSTREQLLIGISSWGFIYDAFVTLLHILMVSYFSEILLMKGLSNQN